jgi:HEAT repeat protein
VSGRGHRWTWLCAALPPLLSACGSTAPRPVHPETDLHHPSATRRLEAVAAVDRSQDLAHVPALIELLDDPDPGVRLTASQALRDLTGRDTGYRAYGTPEERARQVAEWRSWWASRTSGGASGAGARRPAPGGAR